MAYSDTDLFAIIELRVVIPSQNNVVKGAGISSLGNGHVYFRVFGICLGKGD